MRLEPAGQPRHESCHARRHDSIATRWAARCRGVPVPGFPEPSRRDITAARYAPRAAAERWLSRHFGRAAGRHGACARAAATARGVMISRLREEPPGISLLARVRRLRGYGMAFTLFGRACCRVPRPHDGVEARRGVGASTAAWRPTPLMLADRLRTAAWHRFEFLARQDVAIHEIPQVFDAWRRRLRASFSQLDFHGRCAPMVSSATAVSFFSRCFVRADATPSRTMRVATPPRASSMP